MLWTVAHIYILVLCGSVCPAEPHVFGNIVACRWRFINAYLEVFEVGPIIIRNDEKLALR